TDPTDPDQQGGKWKITLKNGLHNFERYLQTDDDKEELKQFQEIKEKVEKYISDHEQNLHKSIIIFATADGEEWYADKFHVRVKSDFYWQEEPELTQLQQLVKDYPKSGIILVQHDAIKVLETALNVDKVEKYISDHEQNLHKSIIIFATADGEEWYADKFHVRVKSDFYWQEEPELTQLQQLVKDYPKSGIILVQHDAIKVLETALNVVQTTQLFELDLDTEDWKEKVGPRKGFHSSGLGSRNAQIDNFHERFNANKIILL